MQICHFGADDRGWHDANAHQHAKHPGSNRVLVHRHVGRGDETQNGSVEIENRNHYGRERIENKRVEIFG